MSEIAQKVQAGQRPEIKAVALPKFRTLLERAWAQRPDQRPSAEECLKTMQEIMSQLAIAKVPTTPKILFLSLKQFRSLIGSCQIGYLPGRADGYST